MRQIEAGTGVTDSGYRRIIYLALHNLSDKPVTFNVGTKSLSFYLKKNLLPILTEVFDFEDYTERGSDGFGSTGI